jgi:TatD DNase family protein
MSMAKSDFSECTFVESIRTMQLIDIGINLTHDTFDPDREQVVARAKAVGVDTLIITGSSVEGSRAAADLAATHPGHFYSTAGIHPHHASEMTAECMVGLRDMCALPQVVAVGECGLDHFRNFSPPVDQARAFHLQLELAAEVQMPVFLHQRDAHLEFMSILTEHIPHISRAVAHCFTGNREEMFAYLDLGLSIGITGWICDERRGLHLRELVRHIPDDRLMLETDAPYLLPRDLKPKPRSRRNEPMYLPHILETVALCTGRNVEELADLTTANARRFFAISNPDVTT